MGRIGAVAATQVGGLLLAAGLGLNSNFSVFILSAALATTIFGVITFRVKPVVTPTAKAVKYQDIRSRSRMLASFRKAAAFSV